MGQPDNSDVVTAQSAGRTRGTETSKYPEEKKTKVIAQVVASERARAQTGGVEAPSGVEGPSTKINGIDSRMFWKGQSERVTIP